MSVAQASRREKLGTVGSAKLREALVGYAFVIVPMTVFALFFFYPMIRAFYISRYEWGGLTGKAGSVGLDNYRDLWHDDVFRRALKNTFLYTAAVVPVQMAVGLIMAIVVNQKIRARTFFRAAFYFPSLTSSAAITVVAIYILYSGGLLNQFLQGIHLDALIPSERSWFDDSDTALWSIAGLNAWTTSGTMMLFYLASLQSIPTDVYEAAAIDGASAWRTFWKITFPLLKPGHFFVAVVSVIGALKLFDQSFIVSKGSGGPAFSTLSVVLYLYNTTFKNFDFGHAAAIGVVLFLIIFSLTFVQRILFGKAEIGY
jgi:multiple sugar transport system permease protein